MTDLEHVMEIFVDADISIIKEIIYFDGWCGYEESGGYLIFKGIDDSIQCCNYGYSVMSDDNNNYFDPREITAEEALEMIQEMEKAKNED